MADLHLQVLGNPQVRHGSQPLSFRTRKALALLIYLAVEGGMHSREKLSTLFWPDSDHSSGRANLRSTLMYLRQALKHASEQAGSHLVVERHELGFNQEAAYLLDLELVEAALAANDAALLEREAARVQGEFLEGFSLPDSASFDEWATLQREAVHLRLTELFQRLSKWHLDQGQAQKAQQLLQQWLALDPLAERAYRRLMQAQFMTGDRAAALQTYESCRQLLRAELGIEPAPDTMALLQRIRAGSQAQKLQPSRQQPEPASSLPETVPLVGRQHEHEALAEAFARVQQGGTRVVVLEGEAGIGKTRLARTFLAWATMEGALVLQGRAYETGGRLPYQPVTELWRSVFDTREQRQTLEKLSRTWVSELSRLFPQLHERYPDLQPPRSGEAALATRLFEAVARLGQALAQQNGSPLLLFVDDLQWADVASLDLLQYTIRRWKDLEAPVLLLVTVRSEALESGPQQAEGVELQGWLSSIERELPLSHIHLTYLSPEAIDSLAHSLVANEGSSVNGTAFAAWLWRETGGQPFYMVETLTSLLEMGMIQHVLSAPGDERFVVRSLPRQRSDAGSLIPSTVRRLIQRRLSRLSALAFELLAAAAVLGQDFSFEQLCEVAAQEQSASLRAIDELLAGHFLTGQSGGAVRYQFGHDKIRNVAYTEAGDARRLVFHQRTFQMLKREGAPAAHLARHARLAGLIQEALDLYLEAGERSMELFAVGDAAHFLEQARQLLLETDEVAIEPGSRRQLYEQLGRAYELLNHWEQAREVYTEMLALGRRNALPRWSVAALNRLAQVCILGDWQPEEATDLLARAAHLAEENGDTRGLIEIECNLSQIRQYQFDQNAAVAHATRAVTLARREGCEESLARSLNTLSYARFGPPRALARAEEEARAASRLYAQLGNRALEADSLAMVGNAQLHQGRLQDSLETGRMAQRIVLEIENSWGQVNTSFHLAAALREMGRYGEALEVCQAAITIAREHGHSALLANAFNVRGIVFRALRLLDRAQADHQEAQERFRAFPFALLQAIYAVHRCADHALDGDWERALAHAQDALQVEELTWLWVWGDAGFAYPAVVEALWRGGEEEAAQSALARYEQACGDNPRYQLCYQLARAGLAGARRQHQAAADYLQAAANLALQLNLPGEHWAIQLQLAHMLEELGRLREAQQVRREARTTVQELAARVDERYQVALLAAVAD